MAKPAAFSFRVGTHGKTSGAIYRAADPILATLILAHGAGAPRTHPFMVDIATRIAKQGVDVVTFNFLYAEAGRKLPDRPELLEACWRAAIATVRASRGLPTEQLFIGGKSMGGRVATRIASANEGLVLAGVVLLGYPLHPPGRPETVREEILGVGQPMLVVQGTRDAFGSAAEMEVLLASRPRAKVHAVVGGDQSLVLPRAQSEEQSPALDAVATAIAELVRAPQRLRKKTAKKGRARG